MKTNLKRTRRALTFTTPTHAKRLTYQALRSLKEARDCLRAAGAARAADYVARALKSAEGAYRHAERRASDVPAANV